MDTTYTPSPTTPPLSTAAAPTFSPPPPAAARWEVSVGALISQTLSVWWANVIKFGVLTLLVFVPTVALVALLLYQSFASYYRAAGGTSPMWIMVVLVPLVMAMVAVEVGALTYGAVQHLAGRRVRLGAMLAAGFRRAPPLAGTGILVGLMILAGWTALLVPGVILACALGVALPAVVAEGIGPFDAIKRSFQLTRGHRLAIFAASLVFGVILFVVNLTIQFGVAALGPMGPFVSFIGLVLYIVLAPLQALLPAVAYHGLRTAKEGVVSDDLVKVFE